ncbi:MAG: hypothetical protein A3E01_15310 [Gammaproteobacteria bacterium RIFCSPHIGHO2_12_FULL_63_22]|nr:MAG: hypothetical protein A3E01_15310 [Gammaproteobacteria bacterium RIFCSPHIGHO2_12_FULL_63_22]
MQRRISQKSSGTLRTLRQDLELRGVVRQAGKCRCAFQARLNWVIVGGESGSGRRPFDLQWARDLKAQCDAAGVPMFFKQAGGARPGMPSGDPELDAAKAFP